MTSLVGCQPMPARRGQDRKPTCRYCGLRVIERLVSSAMTEEPALVRVMACENGHEFAFVEAPPDQTPNDQS